MKPLNSAKRVIDDVRHHRGRKVRARIRRLIRRRPGPYPVGQLNHLYAAEFDVSADDVWSRLLRAMDDAGLTYLLGGTNLTGRRRVNIRDTDLIGTLRIASSILPETVVLRCPGRWRRVLNERLLADLAQDPVSVDVLVPLSPLTQGPALAPIPCATIEVVTWAESFGPDAQRIMESQRPNDVAQRIRRATFDRLSVERHVFGSRIPPADVPTFPIDVVYTWVDDKDPVWLDQKDRALRAAGVRVEPRASDPERFRNRDELKYSMRSLEQFAPWVRQIHLVTAGQCPSWLDVDHPKIRLVDHREIYTDQSCLPTFNSSSIETQLHHVPGLSDKFLYFNDDVFLGQLTDPADFFLGNGVIKYFPSFQMAYEPDIDAQSAEYIQADRNAIELLAADFGAVNRQIMQHSPLPADRLLLAELEARYPQAFATCASSTFRSSGDIRPIAFMQYHFGFHECRAVSARLSHRYLALWKPSIVAQMDAVLATRKFKTFCINDVGVSADSVDRIDAAVADFLASYFPQKSSFEL